MRRRQPVPTVVYDTYWRFAAERQAVFFRRISDGVGPWTQDSILQSYRFTNAYRASDRVSQYLIRDVQHARRQSFRDAFFRTLLFKIFNRVETWQLLQETFGDLSYEDFDLLGFDQLLGGAIASGKRIYSAAYIMPSGGRSGGRKHSMHLRMLRGMMESHLPERIQECAALQDVYQLLLAHDTIGPFLAYQFTIDLNYTPHLEYDEMEFVQPGPGARDGIRKCFSDFGDFDEADLIRLVAESQEDQFDRLGIRFEPLGERPLQLIDCQNLFCEVDKYARVKHPEVAGVSGRTRIKQKFTPDRAPVPYFYPPKWKIDTRSAPFVSAASGAAQNGPTGALPQSHSRANELAAR